MEEAKEFLEQFVNNNPEYKYQAIAYYQLMVDEIEGGESSSNEVALFIQSCEDLLEAINED